MMVFILQMHKQGQIVKEIKLKIKIKSEISST